MPKVINIHISSTSQSKRHFSEDPYQDNLKKDLILQQAFGQPYNNFDFYKEIFKDNEILFLDTSEQTKKRFLVTKDVFEIFQTCHDLSKVYGHYCSYFNNFKRYSTINKIFAFVVDIDNINSADLFHVVHYRLDKIIKPTFIVNSGLGIHLIYQLTEPFSLFYRYREAVNRIKISLEDQLKPTKKNYYKIDHHSLAQAFRMPGFLNKVGRPVNCWKIGPKVDIYTLAKVFGVELEKDMSLKEKRYKKGNKNKDVSYIPNAHPKLYDWALGHLYSSRPGWRYTSMLATVVCGWKARIPKEQIRKDLTLFVQRYNQIWPEIPIHPSEIEKALRAYGRKESTICSKRQLAEWFNTEIKGQKRNGRKREEHLQIARAIRNAKITTSTKLKVKQYLETYKGYSISEISRISGLSRKTIYKYGRELGML
jgi:hypothetical protein